MKKLLCWIGLHDWWYMPWSNKDRWCLRCDKQEICEQIVDN